VHGERLDISSVPDDRIRTRKLSSLAFMHEQRWNSDVTLAITALMNSFPMRTDAANMPKVIKFDILAGDDFAAFALAHKDVYWILLSEGMLKTAITVSLNVVEIIANSGRRPNLVRRKKEFFRLVSYLVMELTIAHELFHVSMGHVAYTKTSLGVALSEWGLSSPKVNSRPMELIADEGSITSTTLRSWKQNWYVVPYETKDHFTLVEMLDGLSIAIVGFATCLSSEPEGSLQYPSLHARIVRIAEIYSASLNQGDIPGSSYSLSAADREGIYDRFCDNLEIAGSAWAHIDVPHRAKVRKVLDDVTDGAANDRALREVMKCVDEIRASLPLWLPYKCRIVPWEVQV
jgi:hypothetical protein